MNAAKKALTFAKVTQDGDDEGGLIFDRLPTANEAEIIRHYLGIAKKREFGAEELARLRERALAARAKIGEKSASAP